jgi:hypothetical protein
VKPLEDRVLLSSLSSAHRERVLVFPFPLPSPNRLPRTGGIFVQNGTVLDIGVGQPTTNTVQVTDDHAGHVQAEWNGGPVHSLTGVATIVVQAEWARHNQITFNLTGPTALAVVSHTPTAAAPAHEEGSPVRIKSGRTSGTAVQSGSVLTVTVNRPASNVVQLTNNGAGNVQAEWNGGTVHSFTGVATLFVDTQNAKKDEVILTDSSS